MQIYFQKIVRLLSSVVLILNWIEIELNSNKICF